MKMAWRNSAFKKHYIILRRACIDLEYHPIVRRTGIGSGITENGEKNYSNPKAYRPITLLKMPGKVLEKIV
jgi:hypothetical protein